MAGTTLEPCSRRTTGKGLPLSERCQQSGVRVHEALEIRLQFPLFGQRIRSLLVHVGCKGRHCLHCRIPHCDWQIAATVRVSQHKRSSAYGVAAIGLGKVKSCLVCVRGLRGQSEENQHENGKGEECSFADRCLLPTATIVPLP